MLRREGVAATATKPCANHHLNIALCEETPQMVLESRSVLQGPPPRAVDLTTCMYERRCLQESWSVVRCRGQVNLFRGGVRVCLYVCAMLAIPHDQTTAWPQSRPTKIFAWDETIGITCWSGVRSVIYLVSRLIWEVLIRLYAVFCRVRLHPADAAIASLCRPASRESKGEPGVCRVSFRPALLYREISCCVPPAGSGLFVVCLQGIQRGLNGTA